MAKMKLYAKELSITDFKGLHNVEFGIGRMTILTGEPDAGKSSVIEALWRLFQGSKKDPEMPIRRGANGYEIRVRIEGDKCFTARQTHNRLSIEWEKGSTAWAQGNWEMVKSITNTFMQNPIEFVRLGATGKVDDKRKQVDMLLAAVKLDVDLVDIARLNKLDADNRTVIGREVDRLKAELASPLLTVQDNLPAERPNLDAIKARIREAEDFNRTIATQRVARQRLVEALAEAEAEEKRNNDFIAKTAATIEGLIADRERLVPAVQVAEEIHAALEQLYEKAMALPDAPKNATGVLMAQAVKDAGTKTIMYAKSVGEWLDNLQFDLEAHRHKLKAAEQQIDTLATSVAAAMVSLEETPDPEPRETAALNEELEEARLNLLAMDKRDRVNALTKEKDRQEAEWKALGRAIEQRQEQKRVAMANAKMPVEGITFDEAESQIFFNAGQGPVPLSQQGEATQLKIAIAIGLAADPDLRLVLIPNGEAFSRERLEELHQMAIDMNFQVIMAMAGKDESDKLGIVLEEGRIKAVNEIPAPKERRKKPIDQTA
jgi:hypothetical protein